MYIVTASEMKMIEQHVFDEIGISALVLMENAGRAIAEEADRYLTAHHYSSLKHRPSVRDRWVILTGKGNNGGDGLVCARHLLSLGYEVEILYAVEPDQLRGEAAIQRDIAMKLGIPHYMYVHGTDSGNRMEWNRYVGIIDTLLGTGTVGEPREPFASLIHEANNSGLPIIAADIPSGLNADTGAVAAACIQADVTVTLSHCKRGLLLYPGAAAAGDVITRDIGIPIELARQFNVTVYRLDEALIKRRFGLHVPPERRADTHKGTYGHVLIAAGSLSMSGAGILCVKAALRAGSGLVSWAVPKRLTEKLIGTVPEAMIQGLDDLESGQWMNTEPEAIVNLAQGKQALVVGPGLGRWSDDIDWLLHIWNELQLPIVIDADGLNMLSEGMHAASWSKRSAPTVITPHPGEMARLCGITTAEVQQDRIGIASHYAKQHEVIVVLKGARTIIAAPNGEVYINTTGNPGMSTGGSGDVLAGIIGGLLAQGLKPIEAAVIGVFWHGLAGDRAASSRHCGASLIAGDIIEAL